MFEKPRLVKTSKLVKILRAVDIGVADSRDAEGLTVVLKLEVELAKREEIVVMLNREVMLTKRREIVLVLSREVMLTEWEEIVVALNKEVVLHKLRKLSVCWELLLIEVEVKREKLSSPYELEVVIALLRLMMSVLNRSLIWICIVAIAWGNEEAAADQVANVVVAWRAFLRLALSWDRLRLTRKNTKERVEKYMTLQHYAGISRNYFI